MVRGLTAWTIGVAGLGIVGVSTGHAQPVLPDFSAATFDDTSAQITHPYLPFTIGETYRYQGQSQDPDTGEIEHEEIIVEVLDQTRVVAGIESRVVRDRVFLEGLLIEDTFDWYAQDTDGNVWYVGEDVTDFEYDDDGNLIGTSHPGQWEAGVDGALPGYIMPATLNVGDSFFQEFFVGEAEDYAEIIGVGETFTVPGFGTFDDVLRTKDLSLDPTSFEHKLYAPGIGLIAEREFDTDTGALLSTVDLASVVVPEPGAAMLVMASAMGMILARRNRVSSASERPRFVTPKQQQ